jgi:hypothetical protein
MKNPLIKDDNTGLWITAVITGMGCRRSNWVYLYGNRAAQGEAYRLVYTQDYLFAKQSKMKNTEQP